MAFIDEFTYKIIKINKIFFFNINKILFMNPYLKNNLMFIIHYYFTMYQ